ncbi:MAG: cell division protein FtsZ [Caldiserica bacterium]|nr:MAG: cell division protein FtsZ [Caldisericota bacterium]
MLDPWVSAQAKIRVIGIGGGGSNAINRMMDEGIKGVEFIAINTDVQVLALNKAEKKVQIGARTTGGLGAGSYPEIGKISAEESKEELKKILEGTDLVFVTAGMGGGTGTGASPIIASIAKEMNILTIAIVTKPFKFEGRKRMEVAENGIKELTPGVDTVITISNDRLLKLVDKKTTINDAFKLADNILYHAVRSISDLITMPGLVNVDFADVKTTLKDAGTAWLGMGNGHGENRATEAARAAIKSPLLEFSLTGADRVLYNITGGKDLTLFEVDEATKVITESASPDANIIFGTAIDESLTDEIYISVIAAGFDKSAQISKKMKVLNIDSESIDIGNFETPAFIRRKKTTE